MALILISGIIAFASVVDAAEPKEIRDINYSEAGGITFLDLDLGGDVGQILRGTYTVDGVLISDTFVPRYLEGRYNINVPEFVDKTAKTISIVLTNDKNEQYTYQTYKISVQDGIKNGTITSEQKVAREGDKVNIIVKPDDGYELNQLITAPSCVIDDKDGYSFTMPAEDVTILGNFIVVTEPTYSVNIAENIENGSVAASPSKAKAGAEVTLTATPADEEKYILAPGSLKVTDKDGKDVPVKDNKFTMPASDVTVTAKFVMKTPCKVTFDEDLMVVKAGYMLASGETVPTGTVVTVELKKPGYIVTPELDANGQYTVTKDVEFKAVEKEYEDASFSGSILTSTEFGENQLVTVPKDTVLQKGAEITIYGKLVVPAGVTIKVSSEAKLNIYGIADIQGNLEVEGADESATEKVPGMFLVSGNGEATISGTVNVDGVFATDVNAKIVIKSAAEVAGDIFGNIEVSEDATLTVTGHVEGDEREQKRTKFTVYGNLTIASDVPTSGFDVMMKKNGTLSIQKVVLGTNAGNIGSTSGTITVTDDGVYYKDKNNKKTLVGINELTIGGMIKVKSGVVQGEYDPFGYGAAVSGITVSVSSTETKVTKGEYKDQTKHVSVMSVSGNVSVDGEIIYDQNLNSPEVEEYSAEIRAMAAEKSTIMIDKDLSLGEKVVASFRDAEVAAPVAVSAGAELKFDGETMVKAAITANFKNTTGNVQSMIALENGATVTVTGDGSIASLAAIHGADRTVNATLYGKYMYVSFDMAIAALNAAKTKEVSAYGVQTLTASAEIPAGTVVKLTENSMLNIGSEDSTDVVLSLASGNGIMLRNNNSKGIEVYGTLYAAKASNIDSSLRNGFVDDRAAIASDVESHAVKADGKTQDPNGFAKWTNIYTALETADPGQTVTIQRNIPDLKSVTVKDEVTLDLNGKMVNVAKKGVLTILGTLDLTDDGSGIILDEPEVDNNGKVKTAGGAISYTGYILYVGDAVPITQQNLVLPGAYYTLAKDGKNVLTTYANGAADAMKAEDYSVVFKADKDGKIALGEISIAGEKEKVVKINVEKANLTGTVTLSYVDFDVADGSDVDARFVSGDDSIAVKAKVKEMLCIENGVLGDAVVLMINGSVADIDDKTDTSVVFDGKVFIAKNFGSEADKAVVNGDLIVCGIKNAPAVFEASALNVAGTVTVQNGSGLGVAKLTVPGVVMIENGMLRAIEATVFGSIDASAVDADGISVAKAEFEILFIGVDSTILKKAVQNQNDQGNTGAAASVSGNVAVEKYALVAPDTTVPEAFAKDSAYKTTVFEVEGATYLTGYAAADFKESPAIQRVIYVPTDADFLGWFVAGEAEKTDKLIGEVDKVSAKIDYNIYTVKVALGAGIENVALNGNLVTKMVNGMYVMDKLKAGTYNVTYTLSNGYSGNATLSVNGQNQSGMSFKVSGEMREYHIQLSGVSASGYTPAPGPTPEKDDGLSLTDYLLIVLVVLIVIMAIIVAMRLMRS
ncbi:MAG: hypothetical protein A3208_01645 [Candidatus Methanoprimaticola hominis]|nr:MAG: hypothetical protein A3208_01645 [Methanomassiliicoccales archaeon Mx-06]